MKILNEFFAVTLTSVYKAVIYGENVVPYLLKISARRESKMLVGAKIDNGTMISVGCYLVLFIPEGSGGANTSYEREIGKVNTRYWGGGTSSIVALFLDEMAAVACDKAGNLVPCDPRWKDQTIAVLRAVGENHPYCSISGSPGLILMPKEAWAQS